MTFFALRSQSFVRISGHWRNVDLVDFPYGQTYSLRHDYGLLRHGMRGALRSVYPLLLRRGSHRGRPILYLSLKEGSMKVLQA